MKGFGAADTPNLSKRVDTRTVESLRANDFGGRSNKEPPARRKPSDPSERRTIIPARMRLNIQDRKTLSIFKELKGLRIAEFSNAGAVLLRVFLEHSVDSYLETNKLPRKFKDPQGNLRDKNLKRKVEDVVIDLVNKKNCDKKDFRGVVRGLSVAHSPFSIELLHDYVHNRYVTPKPRDLITAWDDAQPFFERVWS